MKRSINCLILLALTWLLASIGQYSHAQWLEGYWYRKLVTVDATKVPGITPLVNFPILIDKPDLDLRTIANGGLVTNANGWDIVFTDIGGARLDHEIESYNATTGNLTAWVNVPSLSAVANTQFYMYFGNFTIVEDPSVNSTWNANYAAVWHLNNNEIDGSTNANDGVNYGASPTTGRVAGGYDFDGLDDYISCGQLAVLDLTGSFTLEAWVYSNGYDSQNCLLSKSTDSSYVDGYGLHMINATTMRTYSADATISFAGVPTYNHNQWKYVVGTLTAGLNSLYIDGALNHARGGGVNPTSVASNLEIGRGQSNFYNWRGKIDEVRISNVARSADWIATAYNSVNNPGTFYSMGAVQNSCIGGGGHIWGKVTDIHTTASEAANEVATDSRQNAIVVGYFEQDLSLFYPDFVGDDFSNPVGRAGFVAKYDTLGNLLWAINIDGGGSQEVMDVAVGAGDTIYISGYFSANTEFSGVLGAGSTTLSTSGLNDVFLAKYDPNGKLIWVRQSSSLGDEQANGIAVTNAGIFITGNFSSNVQFGSNPLLSATSGLEAFAAKYSFAGDAIWSKSVVGNVAATGSPDENAYAVAADASQVFVVGSSLSEFWEFVNSPGPNDTLFNFDGAGNSTDIWVAAYDQASGALNWVHRIGGSASDEAHGIAVDNDGVYLTGGIADNGTFATFPGDYQTGTGNSGEQIFVCQLNKITGLSKWVRIEKNRISALASRGEDVCADGMGNILVTGYIRSTTDFNLGCSPTLAINAEDIFAAKYDNDGTFEWVMRGGAGGADRGLGISAKGNAEIYCVGYYSDAAIFPTIPLLTNDDNENIFLANIGGGCIVPHTDPGLDDTLCIGSSLSLMGSGGLAFSWQQDGTVSDTGIANPTVTPTTSRYYVLTTFSSPACSSTDSVYITVLAMPNADAGANDTLCAGSSIQLSASGGPRYAWLQDGTVSDSTIANPWINPTTSRSYHLVVDFGFGCVNTDSLKITVLTAPPADAGTNHSICLGDSVALTASGGVSYSWVQDGTVSDSSIANPFVTPLATKYYLVSVGNAFGCTASDSVLVTTDPVPLADAGGNDTICAGEAITLNGSGGTAYAWRQDGTVSDSSIASPLVNPATSRNYYLKVSTGVGCSRIDSVYIAVINVPATDAGLPQTICLGDTADLGGAGGGVYAWHQDGTISDSTIANPRVTPAFSNYYVLEVSNAWGCSATDSVLVTVNPNPIAGAGFNDTICLGESVFLQGSGGGDYAWFHHGTINDSTLQVPTVTPLTTEKYKLRVTSIFGCTDLDTVTIEVLPIPNAVASPDLVICANDSVQLSANGGISYAWFQNGTLVDTTIQNPYVSPLNNIGYRVQVTGINGCSDFDTVNVVVNPLPVFTAGPDVMFCLGDSSQLVATVVVGDQIAWAQDGTVRDTTISAPWVKCTTSRYYYLHVTNSNNCSATDSAYALQDTVIPTIVCPGDIVSCDPVVTWGPVVGLDNCAGVSTSQTMGLPSGSTFGMGTNAIQYLVTDTNGYTATCSFQVQIVVPPDASWNRTQKQFCDNEEPFNLELWVTGTPGGLWFGPGVVSNQFIPSLAGPGVHALSYQVSLGGCNSDSVQSLGVVPAPPAIAGANEEICGFNATLPAAILTGEGLWSAVPGVTINDVNDPNSSISVARAGAYKMVWSVTDGECQNSDEVTFVFYDEAIALAGEDQELQQGTSTYLSATAANTGFGEWTVRSGKVKFSNPTDPSTKIEILSPGEHQLVWSVKGEGCPAASDAVTVRLSNFSIPEVFTPNGDGINDYFVVVGLEKYESRSVSIFSRWGKQVYSSDFYENDWTGHSSEGRELPDDTYFYVVKIGESEAYSGSITIER